MFSKSVVLNSVFCFRFSDNESVAVKGIAMSLPKLPADFRRDGLNLITRMVRTKDLDDLQGEASPPGRFDPHHQTKLKVCYY